MNKNLNDKIKESIEKKILSKNLILLCLARLNEKIELSSKRMIEAEKQRNLIARTAVDLGISKAEIGEKIKTIAKQDYPTDITNKKVAELCFTNCFEFNENFIPDKWIHFKTNIDSSILDNPIANKKLYEPSNLVEDIDFKEIISFIEKQIMHIKLSDVMIKQLKAIKSDEYSCSIILLTLRWYESDIKKVMQKEFDSSFAKFNYFIAVLKNKLPDTLQKMKNTEKAKEETEKIVVELADRFENQGATYQKKTEDCLYTLEDLW